MGQTLEVAIRLLARFILVRWRQCDDAKSNVADRSRLVTTLRIATRAFAMPPSAWGPVFYCQREFASKPRARDMPM